MRGQTDKSILKTIPNENILFINAIAKVLCSVFKNLLAQRFTWFHISHTKRIRKFSNYQGKTWYCSID